MKREYLNKLLEEVIKETQESNIPVSNHINPEVYINPRPKRRFGCCNTIDGKFNIEISEFVLACSEDKIRSVLAHEVLHTCKNCHNHGPQWKIYAEKMSVKYGYNIKRASSFEEMGLEQNNEEKIRYMIKCTDCGKEYPRQRYTCMMKKINAYRCNCGGKLVVMEINNYSR